MARAGQKNLKPPPPTGYHQFIIDRKRLCLPEGWALWSPRDPPVAGPLPLAEEIGPVMSTGTSSWVGRTLAGGRYRVTAKLGEGGMGAVYRAHDNNLDAEVVIKV